MDIRGTVAIVTGASSGIGLATAQLLSQKGAKVALVARSKNKLTKLSKGLRESLVVPADMSKEENVKNMVKEVYKHYKRIDILVNNAGQGYDAPIEKIDPKTYREIFDLNIVGPLVAMQQVIPIMKKQGGGSIINISSGTARMFLPSMAAYSSLKRALVGISLTAREELQGKKINVSVVYPYITLTDFEKNTRRDGVEPYVPEDEEDIPAKPDSAEYVAEKILQTIQSSQAEMFVHDWMKNMS